jgi:hypothetical protein
VDSQGIVHYGMMANMNITEQDLFTWTGANNTIDALKKMQEIYDGQVKANHTILFNGKDIHVPWQPIIDPAKMVVLDFMKDPITPDRVIMIAGAKDPANTGWLAQTFVASFIPGVTESNDMGFQAPDVLVMNVGSGRLIPTVGTSPFGLRIGDKSTFEYGSLAKFMDLLHHSVFIQGMTLNNEADGSISNTGIQVNTFFGKEGLPFTDCVQDAGPAPEFLSSPTPTP